MCAEDEPITLKEKACRSVCSRCQWVMIERWNPLSAVTQVTSKVKKFRDKTLKTNRVGGTPDRIGIVWVGDLPEERRIWLSHIEDDGEKKYGAESTNQEFWSEKRKLLHTTGSVLKLTVAVSVTISISVQKWHSRIRLRIFSCNRMKRPEVREEECPCGRMCRWPCKDYVKRMCIDSFWKVAPSRILVLQDSKVEADLVKSALMRIVSLMNNLLKGPRGIISSHVEEEWFARKRMATCCQLWQVTSDRGDPISIVTPVMSWSEDLFNADHRTHGIWVVFQDMKPPKSILRKSSDMKKPIQRVKNHESYCTSH